MYLNVPPAITCRPQSYGHPQLTRLRTLNLVKSSGLRDQYYTPQLRYLVGFLPCYPLGRALAVHIAVLLELVYMSKILARLVVHLLTLSFRSGRFVSSARAIPGPILRAYSCWLSHSRDYTLPGVAASSPRDDFAEPCVICHFMRR